MSIRHSLLALLVSGPKYGQLLKSDFEACTGEIWPLNVGQVYTTLDRLERDGFVSSSAASDETLKPYSITKSGVAELERWLHAVPGGEPPPRDELVMKVMVAAALNNNDITNVLQSHRRQLLESMQSYTRMKALPESSVATLMMCDAEIFRLEAMVRWLDSVDSRVRSGAALTKFSDRSSIPIRTEQLESELDQTKSDHRKPRQPNRKGSTQGGVKA